MPQPQSSKKSTSSKPIAETILNRTTAVGQIVTKTASTVEKTQSAVDQVLDLLSMEPPEGREDPLDQLQSTLDFLLARTSTIESQLDQVLSILKAGRLAR